MDEVEMARHWYLLQCRPQQIEMPATQLAPA